MKAPWRRTPAPKHSLEYAGAGIECGLVAFSDTKCRPLVYFTDGLGYSLVWQGDFVYSDAIEARIAASTHVRDALQAALEGTSERKGLFLP